MSRAATAQIEPRKTPVQARSAASVEAILEATIQVLLQHGRVKLTTTRVAERAGVSVGTLYQYFPNKSALLQALLRQKLNGVAAAVEKVGEEMRGAPLSEMAEALVTAFVAAKFKHPEASVALYAVAEDLEGKTIASEMQVRAVKAIASMLRSSSDKVIGNPEVIAQTLQGAMSGVSRATLELGVKRGAMEEMKQELTVIAIAYFQASARTPPPAHIGERKST